jgi:hypothetical protein
MNEIEYIVGVYNYINIGSESHPESAYYMLYLLDDKGLIDMTVPNKLFKERFVSELISSENMANMIGPFVSTDTLNQFAFQLCEELNAGKVSLISVLEYNSLMEKSQLASDFHRDLIESGNVMENIERKKKGFFSRFF